MKAQLAATIVDKATGIPLSDASISLQNMRDKTTSKALTKDSGFFNFDNITDGEYILTVSYTGYDNYSTGLTITNHVTGILPDTIELNQVSKNLSQVIVAGRKTFVEFNPNQITLNVAQSPVATNGNAYDVIRRAPGVSETLTGLDFRGKPTLVLINGRQTYLTGADLKQMLSDMPATDIDKVQIVPNPSAKYDANAQSVIDIKLAKNSSVSTNSFAGNACM